jgi:hypothetical protein
MSEPTVAGMTTALTNPREFTRVMLEVVLGRGPVSLPVTV